jgi:hypothetical protein
MKQSTVQINDLRLRVPDMNPASARQLGQTVARRLAETPPMLLRSVVVPSAVVRVRPARTDSVNEIADAVAARIRSLT